MKAFDIAYTLWGGTVVLSCGFFMAMFALYPYFLVFVFIGFIIAVIVTCPLLIPATIIINLIRKIESSVLTRIICLGFSLVALNYLFFELLARFIFLDIGRTDLMAFCLMSSICLVFMMIFKRTDLKTFFSQQRTTNQQL